MSRRNFILLIILLIIALGVTFWIFSVPGPARPTSPEEDGFFSNLNPFGSSKNVSPKTTPPEETPTEEGTPAETGTSRLVKVSSMPVAGYAVFQKERLRQSEQGESLLKTKTEFAPALRYVDRATGNIYQTFTDNIKEEKLTNTTIPKVREAFFGLNGETVIMRYLKSDDRTIKTFLANLPKEKLGEGGTFVSEIRGIFLPDNITDLSLSPDTTKTFYLLNANDVSSGIILNIKDNKKTQVFDSPFTEWRPSWSSEKAFILATKPSALAEGYAYSGEAGKKTLKKLLGKINGLTILPSGDGKTVLLSDSNLSLNIYDIKTGEAEPVGIRTQAEKCVWAKDGITLYCAAPKNAEAALYPDAWYQGEISFNDQIWKINAQTKKMEVVLDPPLLENGAETDAIKLALDKNENLLFFVNKKDSFLWEFQLR